MWSLQERKKVTLSIPSSDPTVLLFLLSKVAQKKMDKGQYPLSAKRKCHTNIPAANILTLLPAAGARKGGFLKKAPFKSPKNFWAAGAGMSGERTHSTASAYQLRRKAAQADQNISKIFAASTTHTSATG